MREEDEIREAVAALLAAQASGQDISDMLPATEGLPTMPDDSAQEIADTEENRREAVERALSHTRTLSRASRLATIADWAEAGLVPPFMTDEDLEMAVYDRLAAYRDACNLDEALGPIGPAAAVAGDPTESSLPERPIRNPHAASSFSSSPGRPVGMPALRHRASVTANKPDEPESPEEPCGNTAPSPSEPAAPKDAVSDVPPDPAADFPDCQGIRMLMGAHGYYLYDEHLMTSAFARWAFLAAEDDPVTTFVECVRDESRIYPRPMALASLANPPFRMSAEAVEDAFQEAREQGRATDIERIQASNGDVYFFSTSHLSPTRAQSLAEYDAVERAFNV